MITGAQMRMARGFLRWSVKDLAEAADVSSATVKRMEESDGLPPVLAANLAKVQAALEARGITFLADDPAGLGIRAKTLG